MERQEFLYATLIELAKYNNLTVTRELNSFYTAVWLEKEDGYAKYFPNVQDALIYLISK